MIQNAFRDRVCRSILRDHPDLDKLMVRWFCVSGNIDKATDDQFFEWDKLFKIVFNKNSTGLKSEHEYNIETVWFAEFLRYQKDRFVFELL